jgi:hypothetical protein
MMYAATARELYTIEAEQKRAAHLQGFQKELTQADADGLHPRSHRAVRYSTGTRPAHQRPTTMNH